MRGPLLLSIPVAGGLAGAVLTLARLESPVTGPLTLLFVLFTPAACVALLLTGLEPLPRAIVAGTAALTLAAAVAETMLVTTTWSPEGGVIAMGAICALIAAVTAARHHRARSKKRRTAAASGTGEGTDDDADDDRDRDAWVFEP